MRALPLLVLLLLPAPAVADNFVEVAGGVMTPVGDSVWTDYVESGPKLGVKLGGYGETLGAILSVDWTPVNTDNQGFQIGGFSQDVSAHRFRLLASVGAKKHLAAKLTGTVRVGGGLDIQRVAVT